MSDADSAVPGGLDETYDLNEPPQKVWRALSIPAFREAWLPQADLAAAEPVSSAPGEEIRYRMREAVPPFLESTVIFRISPNGTGGTSLRVIHAPPGERFARVTETAANSNTPSLRLAA